MQRKLSSYDIHVIADDMQEIIGSPIDKSYQISRNEILIKYKNSKKNTKESLFIRNGQFLCITNKTIKTPQRPSTFAMGLRKYIQNGRILEVNQHEFDRIIVIKIGKKDGIYSLIIEFFSEGNIILVDPTNHIILPFIQQSWAHRKVRGRQPYVFPPSQTNPNRLSFHTFKELLLKSNADLVRTLAVSINLSGVIAEEICTLSSIDKHKKIDQLSNEEINIIYDTMQVFISKFTNNTYNPVLVKKAENVIDILPFPFQSYQDVEFEKVSSFAYGLSNFIEEQKQTSKDRIIPSKTEKQLSKLQRMLTQQKEKITSLQEQIDDKKKEGELIYLHYQNLDTLLKHIQQTILLKNKTDEISRINKVEFVQSFDPKKNILEVELTNAEGKKSVISLDFRKSVSENAEQAYNLSKKYLSKLHGAEKSVEKTLEKIDVMKKKQAQEQIKRVEETKIVTQKEKTFWFERYRWSITSQGNIIVAGKDSKTNEQVVKKYLDKKDRYAHADIHGAPSCVIKSKTYDDKPCPINIQTLEEACMIAACYSKAWKQFMEAQAYWVLPEQVSKTAQSGEFVPKGAFIIRGKRNYCKCTLQMGIGIIKLNEKQMWMGGSVESVKKWCRTYVIIKPGNKSKKDLSHLLAKETKTAIDDIVSVLPAGGAIIQESKGLIIHDEGEE